ncbi:hypothetical protein BJ138DRAFT_1104064 [Hygrophoropsis aurantiaca]|uniref:Uncharacterized protein n=1 Tax=Hygrophoropsis aurantiaca TaxID=72124 RepID=A0ACB8A417_9AGAM|nr:hypothetical protein BJ138DRAFT_1104064 [Hygrophoropsis aurantiaca]
MMLSLKNSALVAFSIATIVSANHCDGAAPGVSFSGQSWAFSLFKATDCKPIKGDKTSVQSFNAHKGIEQRDCFNVAKHLKPVKSGSYISDNYEMKGYSVQIIIAKANISLRPNRALWLALAKPIGRSSIGQTIILAAQIKSFVHSNLAILKHPDCNPAKLETICLLTVESYGLVRTYFPQGPNQH